MKKILFTLLLLPAIASAQRLQYVNTYGYQYQRLVVDSLFAPPSDTFTVPAALQGYPFIARKGTGLFLWNTSTNVWAAVSGGGGTTPTWQQVLTAGSTLTQDNYILLGGDSLVFKNGHFWITGSNIANPFFFIDVTPGGDRYGMGDLNGALSSNATHIQIDNQPGDVDIKSVGDFSINGFGNYFFSGLKTTRAKPQQLGKRGIVTVDTLGQLSQDTLTNLSTQNRLIGQFGTGGQIGYVTLGSGLSLSSGVLNTSGTVATPISSLTAATGTNTINNANYPQTWNWNSLGASGAGLTLASTSSCVWKRTRIAKS